MRRENVVPYPISSCFNVLSVELLCVAPVCLMHAFIHSAVVQIASLRLQQPGRDVLVMFEFAACARPLSSIIYISVFFCLSRVILHPAFVMLVAIQPIRNSRTLVH